jgi:hypothetical protein
MTRSLCGVILVGICLVFLGYASPVEKKPSLIGKWERDNGQSGMARIVWRLEFKDGGDWHKETEKAAIPETKTISGAWKTREIPKSWMERKGETIRPDFQLELEYWLSNQSDEIPVGATVVERSSDGKSVLVRETWNAAIRVSKDSRKATLTLFRFDTKRIAGSEQIKPHSEKYDRVD